MASIESGTDSPDGEDYEYDYYYDHYDDYDDDGVHWPFVVFDVLSGVAVIVDLLLIFVVLSGRKLRRGLTAVFIISLAGFDMVHLISIRFSSYVLPQFEMHPTGHVICKVTSYLVFLPRDAYNIQLYLQWPTNKKSYDLSIGAIFNDLERSLPQFQRHAVF